MLIIRSFALTGITTAFLISASIADEEPLPDTTGFTTGPRQEIIVNKASKARIKFDSDMFEFGSIPRGGVVVHEFRFKNTGGDTLTIKNVKPTCGCTTAPLSSSSIAPGQEANIRATFNSAKFNGRVTKQIYVDSSDPINPYLKVLFSATINDPLQKIQVTPPEGDFSNVQKGAKSELKLTLLNTDAAKLNLAIVEESAPSRIKAALSRNVLGPKESAELILNLLPQDTTGEMKESITFEVNGSNSERFTIPLKAILQ